MPVLRTLLVALVIAASTWFLGWWSVPLIGVVYALLRGGEEHIVKEAAIGAMLGWAALLGWQATNPAFGRLSQAISGVFPVPAPVLMLVSIVFAGVLAGAAARLTRQE